jgi:hypothetical protein
MNRVLSTEKSGAPSSSVSKISQQKKASQKASNADNLSALLTHKSSNPVVKLSRNQSTPEQYKQNDDRQWHSNQPQ